MAERRLDSDRPAMNARLLLALCLLPAAAGAETLYLNCDLSSNGDGSSGSPWNRTENVLWNASDTAGQVDAGDTLIMSGTCYTRFVIGASGSSAEYITLSPQSGFILESSVDFSGANTFTASGPPATYGSGSSWQLVSGSSGIYKKGSAANLYMMSSNGVRLLPYVGYSLSEEQIVGALQQGYFTVRNATTDSLARTIYVRLAGDNNPDVAGIRANKRDLDGTQGFFYCSARDYWRISGTFTVRFHRANTNDDAAVVLSDCDNYDTTGLVSTYNYVGALVLGGSNGRFVATVTYNDNYGFGADGSVSTLSNMYVSGAYSYNGTRPNYDGTQKIWNTDALGLGVGYDGGTVNGITITGAVVSYNGPQQSQLASDETGDLARGAGIYFGTGAALTVTGTKIIGNYVGYNKGYAIFLGDELSGGFELASNIVDSNWCDGNIGTFATVRTFALASGTPTHIIANNVFVNNLCDGALITPTTQAGSTWRIHNNVFSGNSRDSTGTWNGDLWISSATATFVESNNVFHSSTESEFGKYVSTLYSTLTGWQTATSGGVSDQVLAESPFVSDTDRRLGGSSALRRAGTCITGVGTCAYQDFRGRPAWVPPDIGAYQHSSGDPAATRTARQ
jgi:hypothetical protein